MNLQITDAIEQFDMIKKGDKLIVGLSGGADSVTLTHYLHFVLKCDIVACHINHHLRGEESNRDMTFVEALCEEWGIPCYIKEVNVSAYAKANGMALEEAGREVRYDTFEELLKSQNAQKICTAHTLSDSVETMLLNLTRGSGLKGLCGIPPKRGNIIRPLINCTREDIEEYCKTNDLIYIEDSTNAKDDFARNNIRHNVIPVLRNINPAFYSCAYRTIKTLNEDKEYMEKATDSAMFFCNTNVLNEYDISSLKGEAKAIRKRALSRMLNKNSIDVNFSLLEQLDEMLKTGGKQNVTANKFVEISNNILKFTLPNEEIPYFENEINFAPNSPHEAFYTSPAMETFKIRKIEYDAIKMNENVYKNLLFLCIDCDTIVGKLVLRQRITGDEIEFSHRAGTKSLKKFFIDEKLSNYEKSKVPVFADDLGVVGVFGFGVSLRCAVSETTKQVLLVSLG